MHPTAPVQGIPPSIAVVERIADSEGIDPLELPPLYEVIDPDALDELFASETRHGSALKVEFTYADYHVTVTHEGVVHVNRATPQQSIV